MTVDEKWVSFGSSVTLTEVEQVCVGLIDKRPAYETQVFGQIVEMLRWFAGKKGDNCDRICCYLFSAIF